MNEVLELKSFDCAFLHVMVHIFIFCDDVYSNSSTLKVRIFKESLKEHNILFIASFACTILATLSHTHTKSAMLSEWLKFSVQMSMDPITVEHNIMRN